MNAADMYEIILLALCVWREARGEKPLVVKQAVAWTVRNRALNPGKDWWGDGYVPVILKPYQFSSFNANDPNAVKFPLPTDESWIACCQAAQDVWQGLVDDPTYGATHYFDRSLDGDPPKWATTGELKHSCDLGNFHFYRPA